MEWAIPEFSKSAVDKTGDAFRNDKEGGLDFEVIGNWRLAHNYPLTSLQKTLTRKAKLIDGNAVTAKRLKRLISITEKLKAAKTMRLSAMQDIGGCRAIVSDVAQVNLLKDSYLKGEGVHKLSEEYDYIKSPRPTGYRSVHLVYKYSGKRERYHGLKIEIQLRSANQHAWATAVETVGLFTRNALKSNKGSGEWLKFFTLMGNAIAYMENCPLVPGVPDSRPTLKRLLKESLEQLEVFHQLSAYSSALKEFPNYLKEDDHYFLLVIDPISSELEVYGYPSYDFKEASRHYSEIEYEIRDSFKNAVLVSVESLTELRTAYPNYFLDTTNFLHLAMYFME